MPDYAQIFDECYQELSPQGKDECDAEIDYIIDKYKQHARDYYLSRHGHYSSVKVNRLGIGPKSAAELMIALVKKGYI